jgi:DNA adenine methylase
MQTATAPVLKYPGSKWNIADWIVQHMPAHTTYLEPYFGSGAVLFNKSRSSIETINDIDGDISNLFTVIRDNPEELAYKIDFTPWDRREYENILTSAKDKISFIHSGDNIEDARRFLVRCWMAFGAKTSDRTSWSHNVLEQSSGIAMRWNRIPNSILSIAIRLKGVQIENRPAIDLIKKYNGPDILIYADPPYLLSTRSRRLYKNEMTINDHIELISVLKKHSGPVLISGYPSDLYDTELKKWGRQTIFATTEKGKTRQEVLWLNQVAASRVNGVLDFEWGEK